MRCPRPPQGCCDHDEPFSGGRLLGLIMVNDQCPSFGAGGGLAVWGAHDRHVWYLFCRFSVAGVDESSDRSVSLCVWRGWPPLGSGGGAVLRHRSWKGRLPLRGGVSSGGLGRRSRSCGQREHPDPGGPGRHARAELGWGGRTLRDVAQLGSGGCDERSARALLIKSCAGGPCMADWWCLANFFSNTAISLRWVMVISAEGVSTWTVCWSKIQNPAEVHV